MVSIFNCYPLKLRETILSTEIDPKKKKAKIPNWKLNDLDFIQSYFIVKKVISIKERRILNLDWQIILQLTWLMRELMKKNLGNEKMLAILRSQKHIL